MAALPSDPPANILEARPWLIAFNEAINIANATEPQNDNTFYAGPAIGGPSTPAFRVMSNADLPQTLSVAGSVSGIYFNGAAATSAASAVIGNVDHYVFTGTTAGQTLTLPSAAFTGRWLTIKNISNQTVTIARAGSDIIFNAGSASSVTSFTIATGVQATLRASNVTGSNAWYVVGV